MVIETRWGSVPLHGATAFTAERPLLLVIRGYGADALQLLSMARIYAEADVALVHLPGNHAPELQPNDLGAFIAALDDVISTLPNQVAVVVGLSLGGLAAFGLRSTKLQEIVAVDTPLSTPWPLADIWRADAGFVASVVDRDFQDLVASAKAPIRLLIGSDPLGRPRPLERVPSLVSEADLEVYRAAGVSIQRVNAGHNIPRDASAALHGAICEALGGAAKRLRAEEGGSR